MLREQLRYTGFVQDKFNIMNMPGTRTIYQSNAEYNSAVAGH